MKSSFSVCFDGTSCTPKQSTNVSILYNHITEGIVNGSRQYKWYAPGVGSRWGEYIRGCVMGYGLDRYLCSAYQWLSERYASGDDIYIFGFSRGAYAARSLIGMIRKCGIIQCKNTKASIEKAYKLYTQCSPTPDSENALNFRIQFQSVIPQIRFIGVWDTVEALGAPLRFLQKFNRRKYGFHNTRLSGIVERAYHAIALDEHRWHYKPILWSHADPSCLMEQRWFSGDHCDVGGGNSSSNPKLPQCSQIPLKWIIRHAIHAGLQFHSLHELDFDCHELDLPPLHDAYHCFFAGIYKHVYRRWLREVGLDEHNNQVLDGSIIRRMRLTHYRPQNKGLSSIMNCDRP